MSMTRRELCSLLPAAILPAALRLEAQIPAQENVLPSASFTFDQLPVKTASSGAQSRAVLKGKLATGESLEVHETILPPGATPHAPHHHSHSEMFLIREGALELTVNGGNSQLGAGSVGFVHSNDEHGVKNVGIIPANYFVVAIGPGAGSV